MSALACFDIVKKFSRPSPEQTREFTLQHGRNDEPINRVRYYRGTGKGLKLQPIRSDETVLSQF